MNGVYEQIVAWTFILLRLLIFAGLVWYAVFEYRRWSRKNAQAAADEDYEDAPALKDEDNEQ